MTTKPPWMIVRVYEDPGKNDRVIQRGLTEFEAIMRQTHPESSSRTAIDAATVHHTREHGEWNDVRVREDRKCTSGTGDIMTTADIRMIRTTLEFDIVDNITRLRVRRGLKAVHLVRWFIPNDGSDPVVCPASKRKAVAAMTAEHCEAPAIGRPGQSLYVYCATPFEL
jgi:hypothetical protein